MGAYSSEQLLLPPNTVGPGLGETGRDHTERLRSPFHRRLCLREDGITWNAEDCEVYDFWNVRDRRICLHAGDGWCIRVDRVGHALEARVEDVAEELTADRPAARRGADDCNR